MPKAGCTGRVVICGELQGRLIASAMAGYDGHRGSVFYLAVLAEYQNSGFGRLLMGEIETVLKAMGWPKLNIAVRNTSKRVLDFYQSLGYSLAEVASLGKRLVPDD